VPGAASGITSYGRTSPAEAFAEAFSLFHADPDALRRVSPEALAFFERGGHLASEK
jgi:Mlc titration factor MtfA (ptsG expression regulator)